MNFKLKDKFIFLSKKAEVSSSCFNNIFLKENYNLEFKENNLIYAVDGQVEHFKYKCYDIFLYTKNQLNIESILENYEVLDMVACSEIYNSLCKLYDFMFLIYDNSKDKVYAFRSPNGVIPLYYYHSDGITVFSTHINSIAKSINGCKISNSSIEMLLAMDYLLEPYTFYENIFEIEREYIYEINLDISSIKKIKQYEFRYNLQEELTLNEYTRRLRDEIICSHSRRVGNDNGIFLSGGIDSVVICYALKNVIKDNKIQSFNVSVEGQKNSEAPYAKKAADAFGICHNEIVLSPNYIDESIVDEIVSSNFPYWGIMYTGGIIKQLNLKNFNLFTGQDTRLHTPFLNGVDNYIYNLHKKNKMNMKGFLSKTSDIIRKWNKSSNVNKVLNRLELADDLDKYVIKYILHSDINNSYVNSIFEEKLNENKKLLLESFQDLFNTATWIRWGQQYVSDIKYMDSMCNCLNNTAQFPFYDIKLAEMSASIPFKYSNKKYIGRSSFGNKISVNNKFMLKKVLEDAPIPFDILARKKAVSGTIHLFFNSSFGNIARSYFAQGEITKLPVVKKLGYDLVIDKFCNEKRIYGEDDYIYLGKVYNLFIVSVLLKFINE